ncbi:MAG: chemotaxis protein CheA [Cyclobacteriaceae bacterium]
MKEYQSKFQADALDLLAEIEQTLLSLEQSPKDNLLIEEIFRAMHTLKGAANMFDFRLIGTFTHQLENVYDAIRTKTKLVSPEVLNFTLNAVDHLKKLVEQPADPSKALRQQHSILEQGMAQLQQQLNENDVTLITQGDQLVENTVFPTYYILMRPLEGVHISAQEEPAYLFEQLEELGACKFITHHPAKANDDSLHWDMFVSTDQGQDTIEGIFLFVDDKFVVDIHFLAETNLLQEEAFVKKLEDAAQQGISLKLEQIQSYVNDLLTINREQADQQLDTGTASSKASSTLVEEFLKVPRAKVNEMMDWVSELLTMQAALQTITRRHNIAELAAVMEKVELISQGLRSSVFSIRLVPLKTLHVRFSRLVRDLGKQLGKEVDFRMEGGETELDKAIIDQLADPLLHILRNSMDHGLETAEERIAAGKKSKGTILLKSFYQGSKVVVQITDDGKGINPDKIRQKALEKELITSTDVLSEEEVLNLIFRPGFSTASQVSDVSGRGVGMDVVKQKVTELRGEVKLLSVLGSGTTLTIKLPLTLSIVEGLLVRIDNQHLVIPLDAISHCYRVPYHALQKAERFNTALVIEDEQLSCINLRQHFHVKAAPPEQVLIVSVFYQNEKKGLAVDAVVGHQQFVLKPLGEFYSQQEFLSGATILGDGTLALVLDPERLLAHYSL